MKRPREEISKEEFHRIIQELFPESSIVWKDVPQSEEPPDWYLTIEKERYAVEATTIVDLLQFPSDKNVSVLGIVNSLNSFIKRIDESAREQGILLGTYSIILHPIPNFHLHRKKITNDLLNYIRDTKDVLSAPEYTIDYGKGKKISIKKGNFNLDRVVGGTTMSKREGDIRIDLVRIVANTLAIKSDKLQGIPEPKILLLLDQYQYSFMVDWSSVIPLCPERMNFCCIFYVRPNDNSIILWANSPKWKALYTG